MNTRTLICVAGTTLAGKTTIAKAIAARFGLHHEDLDTLWVNTFGWGHFPGPDSTIIDLSPLLRQQGDTERRAVRYMILGLARAFLEAEQSIVISSTFGEREWRERLKETVQLAHANLKLIRCVCNAGREEIERRIASRRFGVNHDINVVVTYEQYLWVLRQQQEFREPHLLLDTGKPLPDCIEEVVRFVNQE